MASMVMRLILVGMVVAVVSVLACAGRPRRSSPESLASWIPPKLRPVDDAVFQNIMSRPGGVEEHLNVEGMFDLDPRSSWMGLALNGPGVVTLPHHDSSYPPDLLYGAIVVGLFRMPSRWLHVEERVQLVFERTDNGQLRVNSVEALHQPNNIRYVVSPRPEADVPHVTPELLSAQAGQDATSSYRIANFSLLGLPHGTFTYKVYLRLDGLRSNEIAMKVTRLGSAD
jgi:hypothetical protein